MTYEQALDYWRKKSNPPMLGQPCLLPGGVLELREVMEPYVSFFNDVILGGVVPLEGFLEDQPETTIPGSDQPATTNPPIKEATMGEAATVGEPLEEPSTLQIPCEEQTTKVKVSHSQFPRWRDVLHPSQLVTATRLAPAVSHELRHRSGSQGSGVRRPDAEGQKQRDPSPLTAFEVPQNPCNLK